MRQVDRDVLLLCVALQHAFEGKLAADAAFLIATVGVTGALAETLVDLNPTSPDGVCRAQCPADVVRPDLVAIPWSDEADAIRMANDSHYGLAAYVWSHDIGRALRAAHAIEAGWVQVNQGLGQSPGHSYGGYKESGIGREFSLEGMLESYTQRKNVTVNLTH